MKTHFAPAERLDRDDVFRQAGLFNTALVRTLLNGIPITCIVVNRMRQIVFCNAVFRSLTPLPEDTLPGLRPGEALGCIHSDQEEGGCGTTRFCRDCGAAVAILESLRGLPSTQECRITRKTADDSGTLNLQVFTTPITVEGEDFVLFTALDISHEKRLHYLYGKFFANILAKAGAVNTLSFKANFADDMDLQGLRVALGHTSRDLIGLIEQQRIYFEAESGTLSTSREPIFTRDFLNLVKEIMSRDWFFKRKYIHISDGSQNVELQTDTRLLKVALGNLLENALERIEKEGHVTVHCDASGDEARISVVNPGVMDAATQRRIFQRAFSTKAKDRGFGLYYTRHLVENFLRGRISFESHQRTGTTFTIHLPL